MRLNKILSALLVAMLFTSCASVYDPETAFEAPPDQIGAAMGRKPARIPYRTFTAEEAAVMEATFRYLFQNNHSALQQLAEAFCLTIIDQDASPAFLRRFSDLGTPVHGGSKFRPRADVKFRIDKFEKMEEGFYRVSGGYYEGSLSSSSSVFDVRVKDNRWFVAKAVLQMISKRQIQPSKPVG
jgi:hypothetical protein